MRQKILITDEIDHPEPPFYRGCIVRCWSEQLDREGQVIVRFSLDVPNTGQRLGFTSLEALVEALPKALKISRE